MRAFFGHGSFTGSIPSPRDINTLLVLGVPPLPRDLLSMKRSAWNPDSNNRGLPTFSISIAHHLNSLVYLKRQLPLRKKVSVVTETPLGCKS